MSDEIVAMVEPGIEDWGRQHGCHQQTGPSICSLPIGNLAASREKGRQSLAAAKRRVRIAAGSTSKLLLPPPFSFLDYIEFIGAKKHLVLGSLSYIGPPQGSD
jgi:hypothetical protein